MTSLPASDPVSFNSENFLASTADLVSVLALLAGSRKPHATRGRHRQRLGAEALCALLKNTKAANRLPGVDFAARAAAPRRAASGTASSASGRRVPAGAGDDPARRKNCDCGQCQRCQGNARWDRIFKEKFADPTYYTRLALRHDSSLAEAR